MAPAPLKRKDKEPPLLVEFKEAEGKCLGQSQITTLIVTSTGVMLPRIWCKSHKLEETRRADRSTFELGEKDPDTRVVGPITFQGLVVQLTNGV